MKTIDKKLFRAPLPAAAVFFLSLVLSAPLWAGSGQVAPQRFFVAASAGYFYPGQAASRQVYARAAWPVELQLGWDLGRRLTVFAAGRYVETSGRTLLLEEQRPGETYSLRLRITTMRLGLNYRFGLSRFIPFMGAGGSFNFYRERWLDAPLTSAGRRAGFFIQAGGRYRLARRWHALAQLEYSLLPAGSGARGKVNLGGLNLSLGLLAWIF